MNDRAGETSRGPFESLQALTEELPIVTFIAALDEQGSCSYVSPQVEKLLGYPRSCWTEDPDFWSTVIHPDDFDAVRQSHLERLETGDRFVCDYRMIASDGRVVWVHGESVAVRDKAGVARVQHGVLIDMTAHRAAEERYRELFENANDIVFVAGLDGTFRDVNRMIETVTGYSREQILAMTMREVVAPEYVDAAHDMIKAKLASGGQTQYEIEVIGRNGRRIPIEVSSRLVYENGVPVGVQGIGRDITERKRAQEALVHQTLHDSLTALPNRTLLEDRLGQALLVAERSSTSLALLFMDLDRFKDVNDTLGHHFGDLVLRAIARAVRSAVRSSDTVARLGGDEFALLLPETDGDGAVAAAHKVLSATGEPFELEGHIFDVDASIGIATYPGDGAEPSLLMRRADIAMYSAKRTGSQVTRYTPELDAHGPGRLSLTRELRTAIENDQLLLYFQPQVSLTHHCADHVEALIRWQHPERGLVLPGAFIPLAEETGLIRPLARWSLDRAMHQCSIWQRRGLDVRVAVNLSSRSLHDPSLVSTVRQLLSSWAVKPSNLEVEITESAIIADPDRVAFTLMELHHMGIRISIDDFGTGYSSFAYLKRLPIDVIKVDRSFVMDMTSNADNAFIVRAIIDLAHNLGLEVVAEGVETEEALDALAGMGCDMVQGYYLSRPLSAQEFERWYDGRETGSVSA